MGACASAPSPWRVFFVVLAATVWMFVAIPKGFIPDQDTDQMLAITEAAQGTSYYQMVEYQQAIADVVCGRTRRVESLVSSVGGAAASTLGGPNFGQIDRAPEAPQRAARARQRHHRGPAAEAGAASRACASICRTRPPSRSAAR